MSAGRFRQTLNSTRGNDRMVSMSMVKREAGSYASECGRYAVNREGRRWVAQSSVGLSCLGVYPTMREAVAACATLETIRALDVAPEAVAAQAVAPEAVAPQAANVQESTITLLGATTCYVAPGGTSVLHATDWHDPYALFGASGQYLAGFATEAQAIEAADVVDRETSGPIATTEHRAQAAAQCVAAQSRLARTESVYRNARRRAARGDSGRAARALARAERLRDTMLDAWGNAYDAWTEHLAILPGSPPEDRTKTRGAPQPAYGGR